MKKSRHSLLPIKHHKLWDAYKKQQNAFWTAEEIDYEQDCISVRELDDDTRHFITMVLAFFNESDSMISDNLAIKFYKAVPDEYAEARAFYALQLFIETVHSETYGNLLEALTSDYSDNDREKFFNAATEIPAISKKADWWKKWFNSKDDFAKRLVAFSIIEGLFFSGSFCAVYYLKSRFPNKFPGLYKANDFISRDEGLHCEFAALLFKEMGLTISQEDFHAILKDAVSIEQEFITESLPVDLIGINNRSMATYIEYVADTLCDLYNMERIYNVENPFHFMKMLDANSAKISNFFEVKVAEYSRSSDQKIEEVDDF